MILVAVRDAPRRETIRAALAHEGWLVSVVGSLDSAFRMAADHAPRLVVLDSGLPGSDDLVDVFARANGGPGILLVGEPSEGLRRQADAVVASDVGQGDLVGAVKRCLDAPRPEGRRQNQGGSRRWTSEELFGEILEDLDAAVAAVESRKNHSTGPRPGATSSALETATFLVEEPPQGSTTTPDSQPIVEPEGLVAAGEEAEREQATEDEDRGEETAPAPARPARWSAAAEDWPADEEPPESAWPPISAEPAAPASPSVVEAPPAEPEPSPGAEAAPATEPMTVSEPEAEAPIEAPIEAPSAAAAQESEFVLPEDEEESVEESGALDDLADALLGIRREATVPPPAEPEPPPVSAEPPGPVSFEPFEDEEESVEEAESAAFEEIEEDEPGEEPPTADAAELEKIFAAWGVGGGARPDEAEAGAEEIAAHEPEVPAERTVGSYRLVELLAERRGYELWRAERDDDETAWLVRLVSAETAADGRVADRFIAAGSAGGALDHPGIAAPVEAGWIDGRLALVRRYIDGTSLADVLSGMRELGVRMPLGLALAVGERIASALAAADRPAGTVHGSLHPGNVLLSVEGDVLLTDFGLARALGEEDGAAGASLLRYRAPEQIAGDEPDRRSDLFSFGSVLYELVTGRPTFPGRDAGAVASAILNEAPEEPEKVDPTVPAEVGGLISRLLKRRRDERLQGAEEAQRKLDLALQSLPSPPGRRELAAYLRQLRDAVALVRSVGDDEPSEDLVPPSAEAVAASEGAKTVPVGAEVDLESGTPAFGRKLWLAAAVIALLVVGAAIAYWWGRRAEVPAAPTGTPVVVPEPPPRPSAPADGPVGDERRGDEGRLQVPPPPPVSAPAQGGGASSADVEALVAEEFARRQREMEEQLAAQQDETGDEAAEAPADEPPADGPPR
ncbi:MAG: protein kinase [Thermoanaerobaculia bacterium]